jgi:hypothetical protein
MGSPNATVYRLRGIGLILDYLAHVGCCGGVANANPVRAVGRPAGADAGGGGEGAGRQSTDTGRERTAPTPPPAGGADQSCSLLGVIEVARARLGRPLRCLREMCSLPSGTTDVIVVGPRGWRNEG